MNVKEAIELCDKIANDAGFIWDKQDMTEYLFFIDVLEDYVSDEDYPMWTELSQVLKADHPSVYEGKAHFQSNQS